MEANGGDGGLEDGGDHAPADGGGQAAAMEAGGAVGNGGLQLQAMAVANGVVPAGLANPGFLRMALLCLPAREIARCRMVCRLWRDITGTVAFRRDHHRHQYRNPMPLVIAYPPGHGPAYLAAIDMPDDVPLHRPVMRLTPISAEASPLLIHGSCQGILLLSSGNRLYACNPCTRRWARLPSLHVNRSIIGFTAAGVDDLDNGNFGCRVLYHDRQEPDCTYWIFELELEAAPASRNIGRPVEAEAAHLDVVLGNGIAPSYASPPVYVSPFLCWLPLAARGTSDILTFDIDVESFSWIPPPTIQVGGEDIPVGVAAQLLDLHNHLAMVVVSPARVDVWVLTDDDLWNCPYSIPLQNGAFTAGLFAVARDQSALLQRPRIMFPEHGVFLTRHTIQESLLLRPTILPLQDTDVAVQGDDPPFFHNH